MKFHIPDIFYKEFVKPFYFTILSDNLKDQAVLNSTLRETIIAVLCKNAAQLAKYLCQHEII
jgi:hypothetical protein